ncbi:Syndetin [Hondaea fermentalgiana]|uniref:Syndetin n=1 Tax=Hondaea fermentalgiana TaxID=2315210 RepID=A0A2R5GV38_9STRA|nr:Syndetin [Hondaea fermentalgiana]|eukprot:GBG32261.1 Syndetin [Hondaea fermentalgiana]
MATFFKDMFEPSARRKKDNKTRSTQATTSSSSSSSLSSSSSSSLAQQQRQQNLTAASKGTATSAGATGPAGSASFFRDIFATNDDKKTSAADIDRLIGLPFRDEQTSSGPPRDATEEAAATAAAIATCKSLMRSFLANHPASRRKLQSLRQTAALEGRSSSFDEARLLDEASVDDHQDSNATIVSSLDQGFFQDDFDPVARALEGYSISDPNGEAFLMERINTHKQQDDAVHSELLSIVQENHASLVTGMRQVQQIDMELTRASINAKNARRRLRLARDNLVRGDLQVVGLYRRRSRARNILAQLENMAELISRRASLFKAADRDEVPAAVNICVSTMRDLDAKAQPLPAALQELRANMTAALPTLRARVDESLRTVCARTFADDAYKRIVLAYVSLDTAMAEYLTEDHLSRLQSTRGALVKQALGSRLDGVSGLAHRVQRVFVALVEQTLKEEMIAILRAAHLVLANQTDRRSGDEGQDGHGTKNVADAQSTGNPEKSRNGTETQAQSSDGGSKLSDKAAGGVLSVARAQGLPLREICDQLPTRTNVRPTFVRRLGSAFKGVSDLLRNYEAVDHWHAHNAEDAIAQVEAILPSSETAQRERVVSDLAAAAESLAKNRRLVWGGVLSHIATVTKSSCARYPALKLDDFERLVKLLELLALESEVFGGDNCLLEARAFIRETAKTYAKDFHADRLEALRSFLLREHWDMLGVSLAALGGAQGLVNRGADAKTLLRSQSLDSEETAFDMLADPALQPAGQQQQTSLVDRPNPFEVLALDPSAPAQSPEVDARKDNEEVPANGVDVAASSRPAEVPRGSNGHGAEEDDGDADAVLTSTVVNCLAKDLGSSLVMMERLAGVAADIFSKMCSLVWTYLYAILTNYVPTSLLLKIFEDPNSRLGNDFSALRKRFERTRCDLGLDTRKLRLDVAASGESGAAHGTTSTPTSPATKPFSVNSSAFAGAASSFKVTSKLRTDAGTSSRDVRRTSAPSATFSSRPEASLTQTKIPAPFSSLYHCEDVHDALSALSTRIVAAESSAFIFRIMRAMRSRIDAALPAVERMQVAGEAFAELEAVTSQLRTLVHRGVARVLVNNFSPDSAGPTHTSQAAATSSLPKQKSTPVVTNMVLETVDWAKIRKIPMHSSPYVDKLVMQMRKIWSHLQRECAEGAKFPLTAIPLVWSRAVEEVFDQILDAIARIEKCGTEGRALLDMDLKSLASELASVAPVRADIVNPARQRVDDFIKAFYYDRFKDLCEWIKNNRRRYDRWHLENLIRFGIGSTQSSGQLKALLAQAEDVLSGSES